jgi:hypothetical protein
MVKMTTNFEQRRYADAVEGIAKARELEKENTFVYQDELNEKLCKGLKALGRIEQAVEACNTTIALNPKSIEAYIVRAEIWQDQGEFQNAIDDLKLADDIEENNQRVKEKIQKAEKLLKQSLKRDYYKILGVERTASKKEIIKAYRTLAKEWHPDMHPGEEEKKIAELKFMDVASAKEVLSDEKMRRQFDQGTVLVCVCVVLLWWHSFCCVRSMRVLAGQSVRTLLSRCLLASARSSDDNASSRSSTVAHHFLCCSVRDPIAHTKGEDPLDAEQERERQQGGFNPFGGGGGQRFHFRH